MKEQKEEVFAILKKQKEYEEAYKKLEKKKRKLLQKILGGNE